MDRHDRQGRYPLRICGQRRRLLRQRVGEWFKPFGGRTVPMMVMSHQYLLTEIPQIPEWTGPRAGHKLPLCAMWTAPITCGRKSTASTSGPYERNCRAHWASPLIPCPRISASSSTPTISTARMVYRDRRHRARAACWARRGSARSSTAPSPMRPTGCRCIGPMPGVPNAFEACVFTFGIAQAGGAGKVLAEWVTEGGTEWDMWSCDPRRYGRCRSRFPLRRQGGGGLWPRIRHAFPLARWPAGAISKLSPCMGGSRRWARVGRL
jgi:dimethylglycine dehydrogenase